MSRAAGAPVGPPHRATKTQDASLSMEAVFIAGNFHQLKKVCTAAPPVLPPAAGQPPTPAAPVAILPAPCSSVSTVSCHERREDQRH
jgi:hypothetical protein